MYLGVHSSHLSIGRFLLRGRKRWRATDLRPGATSETNKVIHGHMQWVITLVNELPSFRLLLPNIGTRWL